MDAAWGIGGEAPVRAAIPQTLQIQARVASPVAQTNTATIRHSDQFDPITTNNSARATETPQHSDLALTKTVSHATPNVGDTITFTVTLIDQRPDPPPHAPWTDPLPPRFPFLS